MFAVQAGFVAGLSHVLSGPDHLAAIAPFATHDPARAWRGGVHWAIGHAGGVGIIAVMAIALRDAVPFPAHALSGWSERLVGLVLIGIGFWGLRRALSRRLHAHVHEHGGHQHFHVHLHPRSEAHAETATPAHQHGHTALAVGTLHGLAGGSHFIAVIPALALGAPEAIAYLAAYGLGTIAAMAGFAVLVGRVSLKAGSLGTRWVRGLMAFSGVLAVAVGAFWLVNSFQQAI